LKKKIITISVDLDLISKLKLGKVFNLKSKIFARFLVRNYSLSYNLTFEIKFKLSAYRPPSFVADCHNVCQTLSGSLVSLAQLRTFYFALCAYLWQAVLTFNPE